MPTLRHLVILAALPPLLAACANDLGPRCPNVAVLADAGTISTYRDPGRDLTDLLFSAQITDLSGACGPTDDGQALKTSVTLHLNATRGPASRLGSADLPSFVALTRGDRILDKQVFPLHIDFPPNTDTLLLSTQPVILTVPTPKGVTGPDYTVLVGFQLTPEQLARNRAHPNGGAAVP